MPSLAKNGGSFRALHASGCFVLPNPFDIGTARYLQRLGFKALATTSAGRGVGAWPARRRRAAARRCSTTSEAMVAATDVPVNADFGNGFADEPEAVAANVALCVATGVAGLSIEDATRPSRQAALRYRSRRGAHPRGAGGDRRCGWRYAAGCAHRMLPRRPSGAAEGGDQAPDEIRRGGRRLPLCAGPAEARGHRRDREGCGAEAGQRARRRGRSGFTVAELADLGVRRISVGGALARVGWGGFSSAARDLAEGTVRRLRRCGSFADLDGFFTATMRRAEAISDGRQRRRRKKRGTPIGPAVDPKPARAAGAGPARGPFLPGREARPAPPRRRRSGRRCAGSDRLWTYMGYGPVRRAAGLRRLARRDGRAARPLFLRGGRPGERRARSASSRSWRSVRRCA